MAAAASMRFLVLTMIVRIIQVSVMWILMQTYLTSKCKNFLRRKVAKVSLTTVKATTTQPQVMNPRVSISDVYTSRMGSMDCADQLCSFYLLRVAIRYRYIFWFLFNVFVCNAFVLDWIKVQNTWFQTWPRTPTIVGVLKWKWRHRWNKIPLLNHAVPPNQYVSARMEGRKRKCVRCINRAKNTQGLQSGNKIWK